MLVCKVYDASAPVCTLRVLQLKMSSCVGLGPCSSLHNAEAVDASNCKASSLTMCSMTCIVQVASHWRHMLGLHADMVLCSIKDAVMHNASLNMSIHICNPVDVYTAASACVHIYVQNILC